MSDDTPNPELEDQLRSALAAPKPAPAFVHDLRRQLASRAAPSPQAPGRRLRLLGRLAVSGAALVVVGLLLIGPGAVVNAMRRWLGYLPGVGVVDTQSPLRVLAEVSQAARSGITLSVTQAVLDAEKTVLFYRAEGIPPEAFPRSEAAPFCSELPRLLLPDGTRLASTGLSGGGWGAGYEHRLTFAALPAAVMAATLEVPCLQDTAPGAAPEDWALPLRFAPAPPDLTVAPVIELPPAPPTVPPPTVSGPETKAVPTLAPPAFGVQLVLDQAIPLDDGYYLLGHTVWDDTRLTELAAQITTARDAGGHAIPIEPAYLGDLGIDNPAPGQWAYRLYGQIFSGPVTLTAEWVGVTLREPLRFGFDIGPAPELGQTWELDQTLEVLGYAARVESARSIRQGDLRGFVFTLTADPALDGLDLSIVTPSAGGSSAGGSTGDGNGRLQSFALRDLALSGALTLEARTARLIGEWTVVWTPPAATTNAPAPTAVPQACLTLGTWKQLLADPPALPAGVAGRVIAYGRIVDDGQAPSPENYGVLVAVLAGADRQVLGPGVWPALAADGRRAAYAGQDGLHVVNLDSGEDRLVPNTRPSDYHPLWSPDGAQLAFVRVDDLNVYVIAPDGTGLRRLTNDPAFEQLLAWSPDGAGLYFSQPSADGQAVKVLDLATGAVTDAGLVLQGKGLAAALSPDGRWLAYVERVPGQLGGGLYLISRAGGAEPRLLVQLEHWAVTGPVWSPDGEWLRVGIVDTDQFAPHETSAILNVRTCAAFPLTTVEGAVMGWAP